MITVSNENHWLVEQAKYKGENIFAVFNSELFTYNQFFNISKKTANYFKSNSVKINDHVAVLAEQNIEFIISVLGLWLIGAVPVLLSEKSKKSELSQLIEISESKFLISKNKVGINNLSEIIIDRKILESCGKNFRPVKYDKNNSAILMFTSGSTGTPKCVELTFENLFQSAVSADSFIKHNKKDFWLASLPFYHIGGFSIFTRTLISGCSFVIPNSLKEISLSASIKKYKPSLISVVPIMLKRFIEELRNPWENLRIIFLGGGPVSEELVKSALKKNWPISIVYGSTETSSMVCLSSFENIKKFGVSAGKPLNGMTFKILDTNQNEVKNGINGQMVISSKSVAKRYFNLYSEEKNQLKNEKYFSNDVGKIDENGNLKILGRKDDIIISGGKNISLIEIVNIVQRKFDFKNICAIGIKDDKWDQNYALIIEEEKSSTLEKEIIEYLKLNLASYKLPQKLFFENNFPKTELGKIKKKQLAQKFKLNVL